MKNKARRKRWGGGLEGGGSVTVAKGHVRSEVLPEVLAGLWLWGFAKQ